MTHNSIGAAALKINHNLKNIITLCVTIGALFTVINPGLNVVFDFLKNTFTSSDRISVVEQKISGLETFKTDLIDSMKKDRDDLQAMHDGLTKQIEENQRVGASIEALKKLQHDLEIKVERLDAQIEVLRSK